MSDETDTIESLRAKIEGIKQSQAGSDRKVIEQKNQIAELTGQLEKMKGYAGGEERILARLDAVEKRYAEKEKTLTLAFHARSKCLEAGVEYSLISDMAFKDEAQIEVKVGQLAQFLEDARIREVNARLGASSIPQTGITPSPPTPYQNMIQKTMQGMNKK